MTLLEATTFQFANNWLKKLFSELKKIRKKRSVEINRIADIFGDPLALAKNYVEPDCQQFNPADYESESAHVVREPIFSRLRSFIAHTNPSGPRVLLVLSDAGMGKTSFLVMLRLGHLLSFWPSGHGCELFKLGSTTLDDVAQVTDKRKSVLLLDALDEDPNAWGAVTSRLRQIIEATLGFKRVIITCRTQFFNAGEDPFDRRGQGSVAGYPCAVIYNSLLSDDQILTYLQRRSKEHTNSEVWLRRAIKIVEQMGFLRMRPMLLSHMDDIIESREIIDSEFTLFHALVMAWLLREQRKHFEKSDQYPSPEVMFRACQTLAVQMRNAGATTVSAENVRLHARLFASITPIADQHLGGRSLLNRDSKGGFRFSHYSIQEFLVASSFVEGRTSSRSNAQPEASDLMNRMAKQWIATATPTDLQRANLSIFDISQVVLDNLQLVNVDFTRSRIKSAKFQNCKLTKCKFRDCNLDSTLFDHCTLTECDFTQAILDRTEFVATRVIDGSFDKASILKVNWAGARVERTSALNALIDPNSPFDEVFRKSFSTLRVRYEWPTATWADSTGNFKREFTKVNDLFTPGNVPGVLLIQGKNKDSPEIMPVADAAIGIPNGLLTDRNSDAVYWIATEDVDEAVNIAANLREKPKLVR